LRGSSGVYVIRDRSSREIVYVGESSTGRLYETLTRHLQEWRRWKGFWRGQYAEGHDPGLTYPRGACEVAVRVTSPADALDEEARLIRRLRPRDNVLGQPVEEEVPF
jgi:excinuclease UvrABC nuclease subunit